MIKSIKVTEKQWAELYQQLSKDHPSSYLLIRDKMRRKLGFVFRRHAVWQTYFDPNYLKERKVYIEELYLDFYDEKKKTWFLLKYSNYLTENDY